MTDVAKELAERIARKIFRQDVNEPFDPKGMCYVAIKSESQAAELIASALQPQWVSVTPETVPKERAEVFITASMDGERLDPMVAFRVGADWYGVHSDDYDWVISDDWNVTHWMPLPAPPTEQNERADAEKAGLPVKRSKR